MNKSLLKEFVSVGAVKGVTLLGVEGGFVLIATTEIGPKTLSAQRGHSRVFKQLNSAAEFLKNIGLAKFSVDIGTWPGEK